MYFRNEPTCSATDRLTSLTRYTCAPITYTTQLLAKFGFRSGVVRSALTGLGLLLSLGLTMPVAAQILPPHQDVESIREIVQKFLHAEILKIGKPGSIKVGHLDPQLRLSRCSKAPEVFFLNRNNVIGSLSVGVRCNGNPTWTIYVPARVGILTRVAVVSHALPRGHLISANDVQKETRDLGILTEGYFLNPRDVIGKSLNRRMVLGAVITPASIKAARAVRRGEKVTILAQRKGVEVRMPGTALANGATGVTIKVRNNLTSKIVQGVVTKHGEVRVKI